MTVTLSKIATLTDSQIAAHALPDDLDFALSGLQDAIGQDDGGVAGIYFSDYDGDSDVEKRDAWATWDYKKRVSELYRYLENEIIMADDRANPSLQAIRNLAATCAQGEEETDDSERLTLSENMLFDLALDSFPLIRDNDFESFLLKATREERIAELMKRVERAAPQAARDNPNTPFAELPSDEKPLPHTDIKTNSFLQKTLAPKIGDRVRLKNPVDRFPHFIAAAGLFGTVDEISEDAIFVKMDMPLNGAEEWDNCIQFMQSNDDNTALTDFLENCEYTTAKPPAFTPQHDLNAIAAYMDYFQGAATDEEFRLKTAALDAMGRMFKRKFDLIPRHFAAQADNTTQEWEVYESETDRLVAAHMTERDAKAFCEAGISVFLAPKEVAMTRRAEIYLADYLNEELARGSEIDSETIRNGLDAFNGGAAETEDFANLDENLEMIRAEIGRGYPANSTLLERQKRALDALECIRTRLNPRPPMALKIALAREFGEGIQEALTPAQFREMIDRNKAESEESGVCHTHDFIDSNMTMLTAFLRVTGKPEFDASSDYDSELWGDAWAIAKAADFFA